MPKSSRQSGSGFSPRGGTVTVIEAPILRNYIRIGKISFWVAFATVGLLTATVASHYTHPILGLLLGLVVGAVIGALLYVVIRAWPVLRAIWHWLPEIVLAVFVVYGWTWLMLVTPLLVSLGVIAVLVGVPAALGPIRRRITAWTMCLVVRHRLRVCFASFIPMNRHGSLPLIGPALPTPAGERVWVWLRPGLSLNDLEQDGQVQAIAVACWANEVRVSRASRRYAALIRIDVTRREPLANDVESPLPDHVPADFPANAPTSPGMPPAGLDLPDVPDTDPAEPPRPRRSRTSKPEPPSDPSGFDPSDYA